MPLGTNNTTLTTSANFIPELWSDEVIGSYKSNLVLANLVTKMSHKGKKGDSINIPKPNRGSASAKAAGSQVTLIADTAGTLQININKHYEYSKLIEDIAEVQALASMRKFYTDDAGHALATQVDDDLFALLEGLQSGTVGGTGAAAWEKAVIGGDGATLYTGASSNASDITDVGIRKMILKLDDADVPMDSRVLILPPIASNDLLGINRFTEQQFIGSGDAIKTGKIGQIYGVDVYVSSNCPTVGSDRIGGLFHKDALVFAEQVGVRTQTQYKQEYLGDLFTADTVYGVGELRNDAGVAFVVPNA
ncbi:MAG: phage capsid protein [Candidatus Thioglobus sp.]|jgi:N4-gp56 family major capsid protein